MWRLIGKSCFASFPNKKCLFDYRENKNANFLRLSGHENLVEALGHNCNYLSSQPDAKLFFLNKIAM